MAKKTYSLEVDVEASGAKLDPAIAKLNQMLELKGKLQGGIMSISDKDVNEIIRQKQAIDGLTDGIKKQKKVIQEKTEAELRETAAKQLQSKAEREAIELLKLEAIVSDKAAGRLEKLEARNRQLVIARKKLADTDKDYAQTLKVINSELDKNNAEIKSNLDLAGKQQKNIGNYRSALEALPAPLRLAANGVSTLKETFTDLVKNPLLLTITAISAALYGLFKAFTSTDSGGTAFAAKMEQVSAVIDVIRQRAASLASGIVNIFTGNWEQAAKDFNGAVKGITAQLRDASAAADEYTYSIDALEDAEIGYVSERAKNANKLAKLEFEAANKSNTIEARRNYLKEAIAIGEEESQKAIEFAKKKYDAEIKYIALKNSVNEQALREFIEADDKAQEVLLANNADLARTRNNINDEGQQKLEEFYSKVIEADTKFYEEQKRNRAKLSGFDEQIEAEIESRHQKEVARIEKEHTARTKALTEEIRLTNKLRQAQEDLLKEEKDRNAILDKEEEERLREKQEFIDKYYDDQKKKAQEAADAQKKAFDETVKAVDLGVSKLVEVSEKKSQATLDAIDKEEERNKDALAQQIKRAEEGKENDVEIYALKAAELEKQKNEQLRKDRIREKQTTYYALLSGYAKEDANSALGKAARDIAISEAYTAAFAAEGGIVGEVSDTTTLGSSKTHGNGLDRLVMADKREGILNVKQMQNLGGREGFYNLQNMLNNPMSDNVLFPEVPVFVGAVSPQTAKLERKMDEMIQAINNKPVPQSGLDKDMNVITTTLIANNQHIMKTITNKPPFRR